MSAPRAATKGMRPGGRSARVRGAVLDAALRALLSDGFESLSVAAVAREAGVAETTVYRRWPTKGQLAAAALAEDAARHNPTPDTGSLRSDLGAFAQRLIEVLGRPEIARGMRALAGLGDDVPGVTEMRQAFRDARAAEIAVILDRARARGELDRPPDATAVLEQLAGPLYLRFLIGGAALDGGLRDRSVAAALQVASDAS